MRKLMITTAAALLIGPAPALAQTSPPAQQAAKPAKDPNEIICEKQEVIGTRLASEKICKTRAEWAEERRASRMSVEKTQTQRGTDISH
jgi:hypothetical protein